MTRLCVILLCTPQQDMSDAAVSAISEASSPERVFKVVFVGDSGVGKSSFIHRFCHDAWKPSFTATIGKRSVNRILLARNQFASSGKISPRERSVMLKTRSSELP